MAVADIEREERLPQQASAWEDVVELAEAEASDHGGLDWSSGDGSMTAKDEVIIPRRGRRRPPVPSFSSFEDFTQDKHSNSSNSADGDGDGDKRIASEDPREGPIASRTASGTPPRTYPDSPLQERRPKRGIMKVAWKVGQQPMAQRESARATKRVRIRDPRDQGGLQRREQPRVEQTAREKKPTQELQHEHGHGDARREAPRQPRIKLMQSGKPCKAPIQANTSEAPAVAPASTSTAAPAPDSLCARSSSASLALPERITSASVPSASLCAHEVTVYFCPFGQDMSKQRIKILSGVAVRKGFNVVSDDFRTATHIIISDSVRTLHELANALHVPVLSLKDHLDKGSTKCVLTNWLSSIQRQPALSSSRSRSKTSRQQQKQRQRKQEQRSQQQHLRQSIPEPTIAQMWLGYA